MHRPTDAGQNYDISTLQIKLHKSCHPNIETIHAVRVRFRTRRHMWVGLVTGSRLDLKCFSPDTLIFLPPQETAIFDSNSM